MSADVGTERIHFPFPDAIKVCSPAMIAWMKELCTKLTAQAGRVSMTLSYNLSRSSWIDDDTAIQIVAYLRSLGYGALRFNTYGVNCIEIKQHASALQNLYSLNQPIIVGDWSCVVTLPRAIASVDPMIQHEKVWIAKLAEKFRTGVKGCIEISMTYACGIDVSGDTAKCVCQDLKDKGYGVNHKCYETIEGTKGTICITPIWLPLCTLTPPDADVAGPVQIPTLACADESMHQSI